MFDQDPVFPRSRSRFKVLINDPCPVDEARWLVHPKHLCESGTDLRSKVLTASTGKGGCFLIQIKVIQSDIDQKIETGLNFSKGLFRHRELIGGQGSFPVLSELPEYWDCRTDWCSSLMMTARIRALAFHHGIPGRLIADPIGMFPKSVTAGQAPTCELNENILGVGVFLVKIGFNTPEFRNKFKVRIVSCTFQLKSVTFLESILDSFSKTFLFRFGDFNPIDDEVNRAFQFWFLFFPFVQPDSLFLTRSQKAFLYQGLDHCWKWSGWSSRSVFSFPEWTMARAIPVVHPYIFQDSILRP